MVQGRLKAQWDRTSVILATLVNSNPFRSGKPVTPAQFNPYIEKKPKTEPPKVGIDVLRTFVPRTGVTKNGTANCTK